MKTKRIIIKTLKVLAWTVGSIAVLLALALWVAVWLVSPENLTRYAEQAANKYLDARVQIGRLELTAYSTFPMLHVDIDSLTVLSASLDSMPTDADSTAMPTNASHLLSLSKLHLAMNLAEAMIGRIDVKDLSVTDLNANVVELSPTASNYAIVPMEENSDTAVADTLIPIQLNNNFQRSYKLYGVQAAAVDFALGEEALSTATQECREGWMQSGLGCLVQEGTAAALTTAITDVKDDIVKTRAEIVKAKGRANVVMCSPDFYAQVLLAAGKEFTPTRNDRIADEGNVGVWLGMTFVEANGLTGSIKYYDSTGTLKTVDCSKVQYIMYYHETLSVITNFEAARIVDSENFIGSKAQVEMNTGYKVTNAVLTRVRKVAGA